MLVVTNSIKVTPGFGQEIAQRFAEAKGVRRLRDSCGWKYGTKPKKAQRQRN